MFARKKKILQSIWWFEFQKIGDALTKRVYVEDNFCSLFASLVYLRAAQVTNNNRFGDASAED